MKPQKKHFRHKKPNNFFDKLRSKTHHKKTLKNKENWWTKLTSKTFKKEAALTPEQQKIRDILYPQKNYRFSYKKIVKFIKDLKNGDIKISREKVLEKLKNLSQKYNLKNNFIKFLSIFVVSAFLVFSFYLSFFDRHFLIKDYQVIYAKHSYLPAEQSDQVLNNLKSSRFMGIFPNDNLWFANSLGLTASAKKDFSEITNVRVVKKNWPNKIVLEIQTKTPLITLKTNNNEYWRINKNGNIVSQDSGNLRENLVVLETPISLTLNGNIVSGTSFQDYSFENQEKALEKFWFIITIWGILEQLDLEIEKTSIYSLSILDSNVFFTLNNGTVLKMNYEYEGLNNQRTRLEKILETEEVKNGMNKNNLAYIDLRIAKKVFVCQKKASCDSN